MKNRSEKTGTNNNDWETPEYVYDFINKMFFKNIDFFDPCPLNSNFNGLKIEWKKFNYINPPYSPTKLKESFILKSYEEYKKNNAVCVMLLPASTETKIFHEIIAPNAKVFLILGRIRFKGFSSLGEYVTNKTGQTGSMFAVFGKDYSPEIVTLDLIETNTKKFNFLPPFLINVPD